MKLLVCGDIHGSIDIRKLTTSSFPTQKYLNKQDVLIQLGDFGNVWDNSKEELYWRNWIAKKNYTFAFIDGNHDNYTLINQLPTEQKWGGEVGVLSTPSGNLYHLKRGYVYNIGGNKIFVMGGATSHDKAYRKAYINWWPNEVPSESEFNFGIQQLEANNYTVDYILTHTCPSAVLDYLPKKYLEIDIVSDYLNIIDKKVTYKSWHFGHWHLDATFMFNKYNCYYHRIKRIS